MDTNFEDFTDPEMLAFLDSSLQVLDLRELRLLLSRYHMNPVDREEFVREMLALSPLDRKHFLVKYMEEVNSDSLQRTKQVKSKLKALKSNRAGKSQPPHHRARLDEKSLAGSPLDQVSDESDALGEVDDPWDEFERSEKTDLI